MGPESFPLASPRSPHQPSPRWPKKPSSISSPVSSSFRNIHAFIPLPEQRQRSMSMGHDPALSMPSLNFGIGSYSPRVSRHIPSSVDEGKERKMREIKEEEEKNFDADSLRALLRQERLRSAKLAHDLNSLREALVSQQNESEAEEERLVNGMMKRLDCLKKEKEQVVFKLERE